MDVANLWPQHLKAFGLSALSNLRTLEMHLMQQNNNQKQMCFTPHFFLLPFQGGEIKGQTRAKAPNPFSFSESKQECCLTTAEGLRLLPAMTATAPGGNGRNPIAPGAPWPPVAPVWLQDLCKLICPLLQMEILTKCKVCSNYFILGL